MLNKEVIVSMACNYVNTNKEISQDEFCDLFGGLNEKEVVEVMWILEAAGIHVVEEKSAEDFTSALAQDDAYAAAKELSRLTNEELCVLYQRGNASAVDALVMKNSRLIYKIAARVYREYGPDALDMEDLYQEGVTGLMKAAERFDVTMGFRFSTYACWWIRQAITRETINTGYTLRLPVHMFEQVVKVNRCRSRRHPGSIEELQSYLREEGTDYSLEKLTMLLELCKNYLNTVSLNAMVNTTDSSDTERIDFLKAEDTDVAEEALQNCMARDLRHAMEILTDRERNVLYLRFGFDGNCPKTLEEVGRDMHVTRERIRQIECKALRKLASSHRVKDLREYLCA